MPFWVLPGLLAWFSSVLIIYPLLTRGHVPRREFFWLLSLALSQIFFGCFSFSWQAFHLRFGFAIVSQSLLHFLGFGMLFWVWTANFFRLRLSLSAIGWNQNRISAWIRSRYFLPFLIFACCLAGLAFLGRWLSLVNLFYSGGTALWLWGNSLIIFMEKRPPIRRLLILILFGSISFTIGSLVYGWQVSLGAFRPGGIVEWLHASGAYLVVIFAYGYLWLPAPVRSGATIPTRRRFLLPGAVVALAVFLSFVIYEYLRRDVLLPKSETEIWVTLLFSLGLLWISALALSFLFYVMVNKQIELRQILRSRTQVLRRRVRSLADSRYFLDNVSDGVAVANQAGRLQYVNQSMIKLYGLSGRRSLALSNFFPRDSGVRFSQVLKSFRKLGQWSGEIELVSVDQPGRTLEVRLNRFGNKGESPRLMLVVSDITKRKNIERDKTSFVAFVAHQLREPLVEMRWLSEELLEGKKRSRHRENLAALHASVLRESDFVRQLLDISRLERGILKIDRKPVVAAGVVVEALRPLRHKAESGSVVLIGPSDSRGLKVRADAEKLSEVLRNLLDNAIKFSPPQGAVSMQITSSNNKVIFTISDQGPGIPIELHSRIFEIKKHGDRRDARSGSGLGLHFCQRLVEAMGGKIFFSTSARGTDFFVSLPRA